MAGARAEEACQLTLLTSNYVSCINKYFIHCTASPLMRAVCHHEVEHDPGAERSAGWPVLFHVTCSEDWCAWELLPPRVPGVWVGLAWHVISPGQTVCPRLCTDKWVFVHYREHQESQELILDPLLMRAVYQLEGVGRDGQQKLFEKPWALTAGKCVPEAPFELHASPVLLRHKLCSHDHRLCAHGAFLLPPHQVQPSALTMRTSAATALQ